MLQKKDSKDVEVRVNREGELEQELEKLTAEQYRTIIYMMDDVIDANTTFSTDQLKGPEWDKKVFAPLLEVTANNESQMEELLEAILMDHLIHRTDKTWSYHHENRDRLGRSKQAVIFEVQAVTPA